MLGVPALALLAWQWLPAQPVIPETQASSTALLAAQKKPTDTSAHAAGTLHAEPAQAVSSQPGTNSAHSAASAEQPAPAVATGIVIHTGRGVTNLSIAAQAQGEVAPSQTDSAPDTAQHVIAPTDDETATADHSASLAVNTPAATPQSPVKDPEVNLNQTSYITGTSLSTADQLPPAAVEVMSGNIKRARLTLSIQDREPGDPAPAVIALPQDDLARVFFFTEIEGQAGKTVIHRWYRDGRQQARVTIPIGSDSWRSYSSKFLNEDMTGEWEVKVFDRQGKVLARSAFTFTNPTL